MHIGKSSVGWVFSLHVEPDNPNFPSNLDDWKKLFEQFPDGITNEYCEPVSVDQMIAHIVNRSPWDRERMVMSEYGDSVEIGPRNLLRGTTDCYGMIGHGPNGETYSLYTGDFS